MTERVLVVLKSFAHVGGTLRTRAEGPIEVDAEWAVAAREAGLLDADEPFDPASLDATPEGEAAAAAAAEAEAAAKAAAEAAEKPAKAK